MGEKRFVWDETSKGLNLIGVSEVESENQTVKDRRKWTQPTVQFSKVYCPHKYLVLICRETLNPSQKIKFKRYYARKLPPPITSGTPQVQSELSVIILQDIKDLVLFLLETPISIQFINFFHTPVIDHFLRTLIVYFDHYLEVWDELVEKKTVSSLKKAPNPLTGGTRMRRADEMKVLRCILAKEYANLLMGSCQNGLAQYHHMTAGQKPSTQSQGEKDLRMFEALLRLAHRVVWIALRRKHYNLIEIEMHRLFRTDAYNSAERRCEYSTRHHRGLSESENILLHGEKLPIRRKLLRNSPLSYEILNPNCDYRLLLLGAANLVTQDPRINYLQASLLVEEEKLSELGIKIGILGLPHANFDITLAPLDEIEENKAQNEESEEWKKTQLVLDKNEEKDLKKSKSSFRMPLFGSDPELIHAFPFDAINLESKEHRQIREEARKKWIIMQSKHFSNASKFKETSSATSME